MGAVKLTFDRAKELLAAIVLLLFVFCSSCKTNDQVFDDFDRNPSHVELARKLRSGIRGKLTVRIVDEQGNPLSDFRVGCGFIRHSTKSGYVEGETNEAGYFTASAYAETEMGASTREPDWYRSAFGIPLVQWDDTSNIDDDRWLPWNSTNTLVVRPKRNPVPMIVPKYESRFGKNSDIPLDTVIGFDCERNDYLPPVGNGLTADFTVEITSAVNGTNELRLAATVDGAGFLIRPILQTDSCFVTDYEAPEDGYSPLFVLRAPALTPEEYAPGRWEREWCRKWCRPEEPQYVIFRSRVGRDASGAITNATHGIFFGDFTENDFGRKRRSHESIRWRGDVSGFETNGWLDIDYRFNPNPSSRSIEWEQYEYRHH